MFETIDEQLKSNFYNNKEIISILEKFKIAVQNNEISPFNAAQNLLQQYFKK